MKLIAMKSHQSTLFFTILSALLMFFIDSCTTNKKELAQFGIEEAGPGNNTIVDFESIFSSDAKVKLKVTAPELVQIENKNESFFDFRKGINLTFYNADLSVETSLVADYAVYFDKKNYGIARKNVVITNKKGSILRTEELFLDEKNQKVYTQKPVSIVDADGSEIKGQGGFESNLNFTVYQFTDVSGKIPVVDTLMQAEASAPIQPRNQPKKENRFLVK